MKYCPQCNKQYSEAWLTFCTDDGALLREALTPAADPNWDPRIRETKFDDPSEQATQWLPRDDPTRPTPRAWVAPDERAPMTGPWQPQPAPYVRPNPNPSPNGMAIASFATGLFALISGLFCGFPFIGLLAVILGVAALVQLGKKPESGGKGFAIAGMVMGGINLAIFVFWLLFVILSVAFG